MPAPHCFSVLLCKLADAVMSTCPSLTSEGSVATENATERQEELKLASVLPSRPLLATCKLQYC